MKSIAIIAKKTGFFIRLLALAYLALAMAACQPQSEEQSTIQGLDELDLPRLLLPPEKAHELKTYNPHRILIFGLGETIGEGHYSQTAERYDEHFRTLHNRRANFPLFRAIMPTDILDSHDIHRRMRNNPPIFRTYGYEEVLIQLEKQLITNSKAVIFDLQGFYFDQDHREILSRVHFEVEMQGPNDRKLLVPKLQYQKQINEVLSEYFNYTNFITAREFRLLAENPELAAKVHFAFGNSLISQSYLAENLFPKIYALQALNRFDTFGKDLMDRNNKGLFNALVAISNNTIRCSPP